MKDYYAIKLKRLELILDAFDKRAFMAVKNTTVQELPYPEISSLIKELDAARAIITDDIMYVKGVIEQYEKADAEDKEAK